MGSGYSILYRNYDDKPWHGNYQTRWLIPAIIKFIRLRTKYDNVVFHWSKS